MKHLILLLAIVAVSCRRNPKAIRSQDYYYPQWIAYVDSFNCYSAKLACSHYSDLDVISNWHRVSDSINKYYKLMYPNGNPAAKKFHNPCDCN